MLLETASPDASMVVSANGMYEEAALARWKLCSLELPTPCPEKLLAGCVDVPVVVDDVYSLHVNACSFLNRSVDGSQDCPSSIASHDLQRRAMFHIRCMRAFQSENDRHHLPGRGVAR